MKSSLEWGDKEENDMANEVPFPSTDHVIKYPDMWTDIAVNEIPKYLRELANKYNMHFKLVSDIEMAWQVALR